MKKIVILSSFMLLSFVINAQQVYFNWAKQIGGVGNDFGNSIVKDIYGNTYSTGAFSGTVDFDPGIGVVNLTSKGGSDIFITKLNANGNFIWVKQIGGNLDDLGSSIVIHNQDNLYLTGLFRDKVDFDLKAGVSNLTSRGGDDLFILKLNLSGNFIWVKQIGGKGTQESHDITVDKNGSILTTGSFTNTTDFDPGLDSFIYTSQFTNALFVSKLDSSGGFLWAKKFESFAWNQSISITTDLSGNVIFTGNFGAEMDFNPGSSVFKLTTLPDSFDAFVCKLNPMGDFVWAKQLGGSKFSLGTSIITDKLRNIFTTGFLSGKVDFDPSIGKIYYLNAKSQAYGAFISKLDSLGNFVWSKQLGGNFDATGSSLKIDRLGNIYSSGQFIGKEDFDPGTGVFNLQSTNGYDAYVSKLDPSGNFIWAKNFGGSTQTGINDFVLDDFGNIYSTGYFEEESDFDSESGIFKLTSNGGIDIFIHKLGINPLGINPFENESSLAIYPNPNNGNAIISFEKATKNGSIKIINCFGQIVFSQNDVSESNYEINISDKPNGIYFIELINDNNTLRAKLIKD